MTGTATEVSRELAKSYGLDVVTVPTNKPVQRIIRPDYIYTNKESKWQAVISSVTLEHDRGRPVLIGTRTVKDSELLSELLSKAGLQHQVLNAKQDSEEAKIIEIAGESGQITVATNMAGRGTDIKLSDAAREAGGLHVISCEKNISARIDRQLAGRCGRQGDPGSYEAILSLQDVLIEERLGGLRGFISRMSTRSGRVRPVWVGRFLMGIAQNLSEYYYRQVRKSLTKVDEKRESMLAFSGLAE
jgi:preprotein translocase subunit SecA